MKKLVPFVIVLTLMSSFLMAFRLPSANTPADPTVKAISGDMDFTATVVLPSSLDGAVASGESKVYPFGYTDGSMQFVGKAVVISGVSGGSESVCFSFDDYNYGWRGSVYEWTGSTWQSISTTLIEGEDGTATRACATVFGNGTYALLAYYSVADAPTKSGTITVPGCTMDVTLEGYGYDGPDGGTIRLLVAFPGIENGVTYDWEVTSAYPEDTMTSLPASGSYFVTFGDVVTDDLPYTSYPRYLIVKVFDEGTCHAGVLYPEFHPD